MNKLNTLESMTVVEIRKYAKDNNITVPSKLKKAEIIAYIRGKHEENSSNNKPQMTLVELKKKIVGVYADESISWLEHYHQHGWAVVDVPKWRERYVDEFLKYLAAPSDLDVDDVTSWKGKELIPRLHGIIKHFCKMAYKL